MLSVCGDGKERAIHLELTSDPANIATARKAVESLGCGCGFDEASWGELGLVVNEALANVIRHAYNGDPARPIHLDAQFGGDTIQISIRDWGNGVNPESLPPRPFDPFQPGGLGLVCMRQLMDRIEYCPQPDGMLLKMSRGLGHGANRCSDKRNVG